MPFIPQAGLMIDEDGQPSRRKRGRVDLELLMCDLGLVLDLSAGGMRVEGKKPRTPTVIVQLQAENAQLTLRARVAWTKRLGFFRHEIGLEFVDVDTETNRILTEIAMKYRNRRAI
ncbi:MAG TPA: PilZ domain-containing protein [Phycisphaerales bacterium]|nr:PilZ domain-containing protein [Phycisphaerales bacterium]